MKKFTVILIALVTATCAFAQQGQPCSTCLPDGITFTTQAQIDSFQVNYPNCTEIMGDVYISGSDITNLLGLENVTNIGGELSIVGDSTLTNLTGLDNLTAIGGNLFIGGSNPSLNSLTGLGNLISIWGDVGINRNDALTSLTGLDNLNFIGGDLSISSENALTSLTGLEGLTGIGGDLFIHTNALTSLTGLDSVTSIGGDLRIYGNKTLTSLTGLDNVDAGIITNLNIYYNPNLTTCDVQSICEYLVAPNGEVEIHNNGTGCNSQQEVEEACGITGMDESAVSDPQSLVNISPNPSSNTITIELPYSTTPNKNPVMTIYNINGQQIIQHQVTEPLINVDVSGLNSGLYFVKVVGDDDVMVGKFVKQ